MAALARLDQRVPKPISSSKGEGAKQDGHGTRVLIVSTERNGLWSGAS